MLTTKQISDLIAKPITRTSQGRAAYLAAQEKQSGERNGATSANQRRFLDDFQAVAVPESTATKYNHPGRPPLPFRKDGQPLSPSDLAWLQRLPADPTQVPHDDARQLATIAASLSPTKNPDDHRLVASAWEPIRDFHDSNEARLHLQAAQTTQPSLPSSTLPALADAVMSETPQLQPHEAIARAGQLLQDAAANRAITSDAAAAAASNTLARIADRMTKRTAVVK